VRAAGELYAPVVSKESRQDQKKVVEELIGSIEARLKEGELKATVADYIRLVQFQNELEADEPRDIEVRWVEPEKTDPSQ
jgi:hypothetical protein